MTVSDEDDALPPGFQEVVAAPGIGRWCSSRDRVLVERSGHLLLSSDLGASSLWSCMHPQNVARRSPSKLSF